MLAVAVLLVAALTALVVWLAVTEARAVRPAPAGRRRAGARDEHSGARDEQKGTS